MSRNESGKVLSDHDCEQIILKACVPKYQQIIAKGSFFKGYTIRQSELDNLYQIYMDNMKIRNIFNNYILDHILINSSVNKDMRQAVFNSECFIYFLSGIPGAGKSWNALAKGVEYQNLMQEKARHYIRVQWWLDPDSNEPTVVFNKTAQQIVNIYVSYSNSQSAQLFQEAEDGSLIIQDESPTQHGKGSKISKDNLINLIKIAARRNTINLIVVNPTLFKLDNVNYYFQVLAKDKETRESIVLVFNHDFKPIGITEKIVKIPDNIIKEYERLSKLQKTKIQSSAGQSSAFIPMEEVTRLARILIDKLSGRNLHSYKDFMLYSQTVPEVVGNMNIQLICREASRLLMTQPDNELIEEIRTNVQVNAGAFSVGDFQQYAADKVNMTIADNLDTMDKLIFEYWIKGMTLSEISTMREINMQPPQLSKRMKKFREGNANVNPQIPRVGALFQEYITLSKGVELSNAQSAYNNDEDLVLNGVHYTIKFECDNQTAYYKFASDFAPELKGAKDRGEPLHLIFFNLKSEPQKILEVECDYNKYKQVSIDTKNNVTFN